MTDSTLEGMNDSMIGAQNGKQRMKVCKDGWNIVTWYYGMKQTPWMQRWLIADALNKANSITLPQRRGPLGTIRTKQNYGYSWWESTHEMTRIRGMCLSYIKKSDFHRRRSDPTWKNGFLVNCEIIKNYEKPIIVLDERIPLVLKVHQTNIWFGHNRWQENCRFSYKRDFSLQFERRRRP